MPWIRILQVGKSLEKNDFSGFTLIELIVVLVIVGLISSLAIPRMFNSIIHAELKNAARQTITLLTKAREEAYYKKKNRWVFFDMDNKKVTVLEKDALEIGKLKTVIGLEYNFPEGISIQMNSSEGLQKKTQLWFSPVGSSSGGIVFVRDKQRRQYRIQVDVVTGAAQIVN